MSSVVRTSKVPKRKRNRVKQNEDFSNLNQFYSDFAGQLADDSDYADSFEQAVRARSNRRVRSLLEDVSSFENFRCTISFIVRRLRRPGFSSFSRYLCVRICCWSGPYYICYEICYPLNGGAMRVRRSR